MECCFVNKDIYTCEATSRITIIMLLNSIWVSYFPINSCVHSFKHIVRKTSENFRCSSILWGVKKKIKHLFGIILTCWCLFTTKAGTETIELTYTDLIITIVVEGPSMQMRVASRLLRALLTSIVWNLSLSLESFRAIVYWYRWHPWST